MIVANDITLPEGGFDSESNAATIIGGGDPDRTKSSRSGRRPSSRRAILDRAERLLESAIKRA